MQKLLELALEPVRRTSRTESRIAGSAVASRLKWISMSSGALLEAHGYFGLDDDILWDVISNKVPQVHEAVEIALGSTE